MKFKLSLNHLKRFFRNNSGFSLAELMVVGGITTVISLAISNMVKLQMDTQKRAETSTEITTISNMITQLLLNEAACQKTLGAGELIADGKDIQNIYNRLGNVAFNKNDTYGNKLVKIDSITLDRLNIQGAVGSNKYGEVYLNVTFKKVSRALSGSNSVKKDYPVRVEVDQNDKLVKCYSAVENAVETAVGISTRESCESIQGTYDANAKTCTLIDFDNLATASRTQAVSTDYLKQWFNPSSFDPNLFVKIAGDTMTGALTVNSTINASSTIESTTRICVSGRCRTFDAYPCPNGTVVNAINTDGSVSCANISCPVNTYFAGITGTNPICRPLPNKTCPLNQYVKEVRADGTVTCALVPNTAKSICPNGQYIQAIIAGVPTCKILPNVYGKVCPAGKLLRGYKLDGSLICETSSMPNLKISSYDKKCNKTCAINYTNMGKHSFCVLAAIEGPGGFDTICHVYNSATGWILKVYDGGSNESHWCRAMCFDPV